MGLSMGTHQLRIGTNNSNSSIVDLTVNKKSGETYTGILTLPAEKVNITFKLYSDNDILITQSNSHSVPEHQIFGTIQNLTR